MDLVDSLLDKMNGSTMSHVSGVVTPGLIETKTYITYIIFFVEISKKNCDPVFLWRINYIMLNLLMF